MTLISGFFLGHLFYDPFCRGRRVWRCGEGRSGIETRDKKCSPSALWGGGGDDRFVFIFICPARYQTMMIYLRERTRSTAMLGKYEISPFAWWLMIVKTRSQRKSCCIVVQNPYAIPGTTMRISRGLNVTQNSAILMGHCQFTGNILALPIRKSTRFYLSCSNYFRYSHCHLNSATSQLELITRRNTW